MSRLDQLRQMLEADPDAVFLNFGLAMEYVKTDQPEQALEQFSRVTQIDPDYAVGYFQHATTLVNLGRKTEAAEVLRQGIDAARRTHDNHAAAEMGEMLTLLQ